ncbi:MAG: hypothetical protein UX09_C0012G0012 [Candidatus Uhrbacteria bacterium GW2011_GWE2_45_35]|uniref:Nudix hydrolase domain-containing protein n=2 Tax=Candidatus Uhriibacteriota TaxID=1752732 RepID=A0A0G1JIY9_9BACT|nr:MAG: hypothetical protein UW63_C0013G0007 [Candidatus Uhrbacteria bacterium GW2011_GWF2_44_350]KKU08799.1 MAG: hypothetical protein UX09_C0012G0012 [Candidatus Uhrbacteria bacterium GW2011_GWE2_45_35]HBR80669.1 hypothetical protein [Candidatus Uhrbacteria bacterium]HCU31147.1 hypothetical protein [Candidatus Uhrbacteria bacterium]
MIRQAAISLITRPGRNYVLLGLNNQGRHKGRIIPPSETVKPGETPLQAAYRGIKEEVHGVSVGKLRPVGVFQIFFEGTPEHNIELHVFRGTIIRGTPRACRKEFSWLKFYRSEKAPVDKMWPDARLWWPRLQALGPTDAVLGLRLTLPAEPRFVVSRINPPSSEEVAFAKAV